jgi:GntR family L-lactate dehydrogenase operon transcriptional regulator
MVGVVRSRAGDGTYIARASPLVDQSRISELLGTGSSPSEVLDARLILETSAAMFAAERATPSDIAELKKAFQQLEKAMEAADSEAVVQNNMLLHLAVVKATHNPVATEVLSPLVRLMGGTLSKYMRRQLLAHERGNKELLSVHRKIVNAISAKKPTAAWKAMREHFQSVAQGLGFLDGE